MITRPERCPSMSIEPAAARKSRRLRRRERQPGRPSAVTHDAAAVPPDKCRPAQGKRRPDRRPAVPRRRGRPGRKTRARGGYRPLTCEISLGRSPGSGSRRTRWDEKCAVPLACPPPAAASGRQLMNQLLTDVSYRREFHLFRLTACQEINTACCFRGRGNMQAGAGGAETRPGPRGDQAGATRRAGPEGPLRPGRGACRDRGRAGEMRRPGGLSPADLLLCLAPTIGWHRDDADMNDARRVPAGVRGTGEERAGRPERAAPDQKTPA